MMRRLSLLFVAVVCVVTPPSLALRASASQAVACVQGGDSVILITLDGARTQEIFASLDVDVLRSTLSEKQKVEDSPVYKRYYADTSEQRREKLMPFFWRELMVKHGLDCRQPAAE